MQLNEQTKLERRIVSRFRKALSNYQLIADNDSVLVALSGGKDSLCLLELMARQAHVYRPKFRIEAVHVRMENIHYESDTSYLEQFCHQHDVKLHVINTRFTTADTTPLNDSPDIRRKQKTPCFLCSWYRRKAIFNLAQSEGFNKIALGHHQDDILHTTLMNLCFQGRFDGMPVSLKMKRMPLTLIRPLCLEHEADIKALADIRQYHSQLKTCPYDQDTNRKDIAQLFQQMEQANPEVRHSMWHALEAANKLVEY